jgi:hypothetical protein
MASRLAGLSSARANGSDSAPPEMGARASKKRWTALAASAACAGVLVAIDATGCASSTQAPFAPPGGEDSGPGQTTTLPDGGTILPGLGSDAGLGGLVHNDSGTVGSTDCPAGAGKFIYVVSDQNELYTFDPTLVPTAAAPGNKPFADLGPINCPNEPTPPPDNGGVNSMAVDRQAIAWINFNDGKIFKVDTTQASLPCTDTNYVAGQQGFTAQLGMGFATASATDTTERLYVSDNAGPGGEGNAGAGKGLGWIDTTTMTMATLGGWGSPLAGYNAELSGTGGGILYGFFTTTPSAVAQIDKTNAATSNVTSLTTVNNSVGGYAFSFWGGDFWIYTAYPTATDPNATTSVTHVVSADGGVGVAMADIGFTIVGAGSSTCVPTVPPPIAK